MADTMKAATLIILCTALALFAGGCIFIKGDLNIRTQENVAICTNGVGTVNFEALHEGGNQKGEGTIKFK